MITPERLKELREIAEAASEGITERVLSDLLYSWYGVVNFEGGSFPQKPNVELWAGARENILALVDEVERLSKLVGGISHAIKEDAFVLSRLQRLPVTHVAIEEVVAHLNLQRALASIGIGERWPLHFGLIRSGVRRLARATEANASLYLDERESPQGDPVYRAESWSNEMFGQRDDFMGYWALRTDGSLYEVR